MPGNAYQNDIKYRATWSTTIERRWRGGEEVEGGSWTAKRYHNLLFGTHTSNHYELWAMTMRHRMKRPILLEVLLTREWSRGCKSTDALCYSDNTLTIIMKVVLLLLNNGIEWVNVWPSSFENLWDARPITMSFVHLGSAWVLMCVVSRTLCGGFMHSWNAPDLGVITTQCLRRHKFSILMLRSLTWYPRTPWGFVLIRSQVLRNFFHR